MSTSNRSLRPSRTAGGAFATFYHLKRYGMSSVDAHQCVRRWSYEVKSTFSPNPLSMVTRKHLSGFYDRPGHHTGD